MQALNLVRIIPFIFRTPPPPYRRVCKKAWPLDFLLDFDQLDWPMENTLNRTQKSPPPKFDHLSISFQLQRVTAKNNMIT